MRRNELIFAMTALCLLAAALALPLAASRSAIARVRSTSASDPRPSVPGAAFSRAASSAGWHTEAITSGVEIGRISLALDSLDRPRVAFYDHSHFTLRYAQSDGGAWRDEAVAAGNPAATTGERSSLRLDSAGGPQISYTTIYRSTHPPFSFFVDYARRTADGWQTSRVGAGSATSLGVDPAGQPRVAYAEAGGSLKYAWLEGTTWRQETVDSAGDLALLDLEAAERPAIVYADCNRLKYASRSSAGWRVELVEALPTTICATPLANRGTSCPQIGYYDAAGGSLRFLRRRGAGWERVPALDLQIRGSGFSLALDGSGRPHLSYSNDAARTIEYAWFDGAAWQSEIVDTSPYGYAPTALALDRDGQPRVVYAGGADSALRYARRLLQPQASAAPAGAAATLYIPIALQGC